MTLKTLTYEQLSTLLERISVKKPETFNEFRFRASWIMNRIGIELGHRRAKDIFR